MRDDEDGRDEPARTTEPILRFAKNFRSSSDPKFFFIIFVDAIFTILFERLFTNVFDVTAQTIANPCLYLTGNAD